MPTVFYKRATFVTHLPDGHRYTHAHSWLSQAGGNVWRVGYTKFALRMLGEIVDLQVDRKAGEQVEPGDVIGTIEGFKALSDLYCVGSGRFLHLNPALAQNLELLANDPYQEGWIYEFEGTPDKRSLDVSGYRNLLDATIDRMLQKEQETETQP